MRPVSSEARAGEHTGDTQKKLSSCTPPAASASILGVLLELEDVAFGAAYDADTGYDEITIQPL